MLSLFRWKEGTTDKAGQHGGTDESHTTRCTERPFTARAAYIRHPRETQGQAKLICERRDGEGGQERDMRSISGTMDKFCLMIWVVAYAKHIHRLKLTDSSLSIYAL